MPSVTLYPSAFVSGSYSGISGQTNPVGKGSNNTSNYATITCTTGRNAQSYAFWSFDCSSIPANATIDSVSCTARCYVSSTTYVTTRAVQLYNGTSNAKGSSVSFSNSTSQTQTLSCGSWTRSELDDINIRVFGQRGTSNTSRSATMRFYGATLTINYTVNHTISVSGAAGSSGYNVSGNGEVAEGSNATITFQAQNTGHIIDSLTDNGNDVTNNVVSIGGDQFTYTINNVQEDHALVVHFRAPNYNVTSSFTGPGNISPTGTRVLNPGDNYTLTMTPGDPNNVMVTLTDNGVDVSSQITESGGVYSYTISNIDADHTLVASFKTGYRINISLTGSGTISSGGMIEQGDNYILTITPTYPDDASITLTDNGSDVSGLIVSYTTYFTYTLSNVNSAHNLNVTIEYPGISIVTFSVTGSHISRSEVVVNSSQSYANGSTIRINSSNTVDVRISMLSNEYICDIFDNGINILTNGFLNASGQLQVPIENTQIDHDIVVTERVANQYSVSFLDVGPCNFGFLDSSNNSISTLSFYEGSSVTFFIADAFSTFDSSGKLCIIEFLKVNNIDYTPESFDCYSNYPSGGSRCFKYTTPILFSNSSVVIKSGYLANFIKVYDSTNINGYAGGGSYKPVNYLSRSVINNSELFIYKRDGILHKSIYFSTQVWVDDPPNPGYYWYPADTNQPVIKYGLTYNTITTNLSNDHFYQPSGNWYSCIFVFPMSELSDSVNEIYIKAEIGDSIKSSYNVTTSQTGLNNISSSSTVTKQGTYNLIVTPSNINDEILIYDCGYDITDLLTKNSNNYTYTISNIHHNHIINAYKAHCINTAINGDGKITDSKKVISGSNEVITITPFNSEDIVTLTDNGNDVTSSLVNNGSNYTYTISDISSNHNLIASIGNSTQKYISTSITGKGIITNSQTVDIGEDFNIIITPTYYSVSTVTLMDNGNDVSSQLVGNGNAYTYTLSNIQTNHVLVANIIVPNYTITTSITGSGTISSGQTVECGDACVVTITPSNMISDMVVLTDNTVDVSNSLVNTGSAYTYQLSNITTNHTIVATITAIPEVVDWKIKVPTQTRDINSNGTWSSIDTPYYKMNNSWITPEKVYYKHGGNWLLVWPLTPPVPSHLLFAADLTSDLSYISYIDGGATGVFTVNPGFTPSYDSDGIFFPSDSSNFRIGTVIPNALNTFLHTANQEIWFSMRATVIRDVAGSSSYYSGCDYGWGTNTSYPYYRQDSAHNFFSINGEFYKNRSGEPYVPAGTTVWLKTQYTSSGAFIQRVFSYSTWTGSNAYSNPGTWQQNFSNTTSSKAIWNNPTHTTMGLHHGQQEIKVRDFKIWSYEPTDAEIGIQ